MRTAEEVLNVIRDRGVRGLPLDDVYRQLYNPDLYLRAYDRIHRNAGAMTRGVTQETVDGMSLEKIEQIIEALRFERYRWTPVRRVEIPKAKQPGKTRPLGIPTWSDKLLQEVIRSLLEAYYDPQFADQSHGFRPVRGCHTTLQTLSDHWWGTKWFIEGDIKGCFDNIDHEVLLSILREKIQDNRFLRLIENLLKAGYLEQWDYRPTTSGTPQGGVVSPILANIYLDRLDQHVVGTLIPTHTKGNRRKANPEYKTIGRKLKKLRSQGNHEEAKTLEKIYQSLPSRDPEDPDFRRLHYVRYADDFLLGYVGPKAEAENIKAQLKEFLQDKLKLELSTEKTLVTHATTEAARFLGYEVAIYHENTRHTRGHRSINGQIALAVPAQVVEDWCGRYMKDGKAIHRSELINDDDLTIIHRYQAEFRGIVQYYQLAYNVAARLGRLNWVMQTSLTKTLARKHQITVAQVFQRYRSKVETPYGPRACLRATRERKGKLPLVAIFGGVPLRRKKKAVIKDVPTYRFRPQRGELVQRLVAQECELCGATENLEVHHIRKLADLKRPGQKEKPYWARLMAARKRKSLVLCGPCHTGIHQGRPPILQNAE